MRVLNVLPVLQVSGFDAAVAWYESLFGRPPDRRPMDGLAEWQLAASGGVQVYRESEGAGATNVVIAVDDMDATLEELANRGLNLEAETVPSGRFRLASVQDPDGNTLVFSQELSVP
jgi:predicted enzyme related to lactoylglutathione lyase